MRVLVEGSGNRFVHETGPEDPGYEVFPTGLSKPVAADPAAWGPHGSIHRRCPYAWRVIHVALQYYSACFLIALALLGIY